MKRTEALWAASVRGRETRSAARFRGGQLRLDDQPLFERAGRRTGKQGEHGLASLDRLGRPDLSRLDRYRLEYRIGILRVLVGEQDGIPFAE